MNERKEILLLHFFLILLYLALKLKIHRIKVFLLHFNSENNQLKIKPLLYCGRIRMYIVYAMEDQSRLWLSVSLAAIS